MDIIKGWQPAMAKRPTEWFFLKGWNDTEMKPRQFAGRIASIKAALNNVPSAHLTKFDPETLPYEVTGRTERALGITMYKVYGRWHPDRKPTLKYEYKDMEHEVYV